MSRISRLLLAAALIGATGCQGAENMPKTYPVLGTVFYKGGKPLQGGTVQFMSPTDPSLTVVGNIQNDGTFTLSTIRNQTKVDGAAEGEYRVTIVPPIPADRKSFQPPMPVPKPYKVEAKENQFQIELHVPPPQ